MRWASVAAATRAMATSGPNAIADAAAAGSDRAEHPALHPHPRYGSRCRLQRTGTRASNAAARINGVLSNRVLAAVARIDRSVSGGSAAANNAIGTSTIGFMTSKFGAPRGTQDLIPPQSATWQELEARIHTLARRYGYGEVRTPM